MKTHNLKNLSELKPGETGTVYDIDRSKIDILKKILMMGLLPGVFVRLVRRFPSFLYEVYHTRFVIDRELASQIVLDVDNAVDEMDDEENPRGKRKRWRFGK